MRTCLQMLLLKGGELSQRQEHNPDCPVHPFGFVPAELVGGGLSAEDELTLGVAEGVAKGPPTAKRGRGSEEILLERSGNCLCTSVVIQSLTMQNIFFLLSTFGL